jgi:3-oxoacyl-[acyl-carrier protein] reductase
MDLKLTGKRALVQGSSSGLGRAIAEALIKEGAKVAICSRDSDKIAKIAREIGAHAAIASDLTHPGAGKILVEAAAKQLGGLDILVTNTGGPPKGLFEEITATQWQEGFQSLWLSATESIQAALPFMRKDQWGRILLITSAAAREPMPLLNISNGLRAGLLGLTKAISNEVAQDGITINALLPGYTDTERLQQLNVPKEKITSQIPAGRLGTPEEFAALATFLASGQAGYITGQGIACDGGYLRSI